MHISSVFISPFCNHLGWQKACIFCVWLQILIYSRDIQLHESLTLGLHSKYNNGPRTRKGNTKMFMLYVLAGAGGSHGADCTIEMASTCSLRVLASEHSG